MKKINFRDLMTAKGFRYGGYASLIAFAVIVAVVVINLIIGQFNVQGDLTSSGLFTLSTQSRKVVDNLKQEITIYALYPRGQEQQEILEGLKRYQEDSKHIHVQVIDPETNPGFVAKYQTGDNKNISNGSLIVQGENHFKVIPNSDLYSVDYRNPQNPQLIGITLEKQVTNALLFVSSGESPIIYELTGHKELSLSSLGLSDQVTQENFQLKDLDLVKQQSVPSNAAIVAIIDPSVDISTSEEEALKKYLADNGKLFVAKDVAQNDLPNLQDLLTFYGVKFQSGIVVDMDSNHHAANNSAILFPVEKDSPIVNPISQAGTPIVIPFAQGIQNTELKTRAVQVTPILTSSNNSFLRTDLTNNSNSKLPGDVNGPITIAASISDRTKLDTADQFRLVIIGSASFLQGQFGQLPGNSDLLLNSLSWLQNRQDTLSISSKTTLQFPMRLTATQVLIFAGLFVIIIPLAILIAGTIVWLRRRHL